MNFYRLFRDIAAVSLALFVLLCTYAALAGECDITKALAAKYHADAEVVLSDGSRADLISERYAIEVEWSKKWKESIGQCELYSILTGKEPGVILLVKDPAAEAKHIERCHKVCDKLKIKLWIERVEP